MKKPFAPITNPSSTTPSLTKEHYEAPSEFRYQLRRFLHFSETAAKAEDLTAQLYLLLLHVQDGVSRYCFF